jgi:hypothetical protein
VIYTPTESTPLDLVLNKICFSLSLISSTISSRRTKAPPLIPTPVHLPESLGVGWTVKILEYFRWASNNPGYPVVGASVSFSSVIEAMSSKSVQEPIPRFHTTLATLNAIVTGDYTESSKLQ